jgi:hypothetical protein
MRSLLTEMAANVRIIPHFVLAVKSKCGDFRRKEWNPTGGAINTRIGDLSSRMQFSVRTGKWKRGKRGKEL